MVATVPVKPPALRYSPALEGLRSLLLILVIVAHTQQFLVPQASGLRVSGFGTLTTFFVLTGYLVTAIVLRNIERTNGLDYQNFLSRRVQRLGIPMLLFAVVQFATVAMTGGRLIEPKGVKTLGELPSVAALMTYTLNFAPSFNFNQRFDMVQMWSLGVDMQFYLAWPLVLWLIFKWTKDTKKIIILLAVGVVVVQFTRVVEYHLSAGNRLFPADVYQRPENSLDPFFAGAILCFLWKKRAIPTVLFKKLWLPSLVILILGMIFVLEWSPVPYYGGYFVVTLCALVVVGDAMREGSPINRFFSTLPLRAIGRVSFTVYIWHLYVFVWFNRWASGVIYAPVRVVLAYVMLAAVTLVAWRIAEKPFLRLPPLRNPKPIET